MGLKARRLAAILCSAGLASGCATAERAGGACGGGYGTFSCWADAPRPQQEPSQPRWLTALEAALAVGIIGAVVARNASD